MRECMGLLYPNLEKHIYLRSLGLELDNIGYHEFSQYKQDMYAEYQQCLRNEQGVW